MVMSLISERDHIRILLPVYALWQLGDKLTEADKSAWRLLADKLGLAVEQMEAAESKHPDNPGYGVIAVWSQNPKSTIGVLRKTLEELQRKDLVEMLDKARQSKYSSAKYLVYLV